MKNKTLFFIVILIFIGTMSLLAFKNKSQVVHNPEDQTVGKQCFTRTENATKEDPYTVTEHVVLNFSGTKVLGTKNGTQAGPDMTNGYEGMLYGSIIGDEMELTYQYTIEGSKQRELEVYTLDGGNLVKKRWALKETKINNADILVPDYVGDPTLITYEKEDCTN